MTITKIKTDEQWHALRKQTIGGSECAIVFGVSPYGTLNELYHIKKGNFAPSFENKLMQWGNAIEPVIANFISKDNYWDLKHCRDYHQHPEHKYLGATLDYYVIQSEHGPGILEIKAVNAFSPNWTSNRAPMHVELQIQHQFLVVNAARKAAGLDEFKWGAIGSMHSGNPEDIRIMRRYPDKQVHEHIIEQCGKFWADIQADNEPDLIGPKEYEHISEMFKFAPEEKQGMTLIDRGDDPVLDDLIMAYEQAKLEKKNAEGREKTAKAKILHSLMLMDDNGVTKCGAARTKNYSVETSMSEINYKAKPARTSTQLNFKTRPVNA